MASSSFPAVPPTLKPVQTCMKLAADLEKVDHVVAYWCRFYVVQAGLKIDSKSKDCVAFLMTVMDWLEKEKKGRKENEAITNEMVAQAHVENYALQVFNKADNNDRAGDPNYKSTCRLFFIASNLFEVLSVFGEIPEEIQKRAKYAKWKAFDINRCIKSGETPTAGPVEGTDAEEFLDFSAVSANYGDLNSTEVTGDATTSSDASISAAQNTNPHNYNAYSQIPAPNAVPRAVTPTTTATNGVPLSAEDLLKAQKFCKFAGSALQYEDVSTAITNLQKALSLLTTGSENI